MSESESTFTRSLVTPISITPHGMKLFSLTSEKKKLRYTLLKEKQFNMISLKRHIIQVIHSRDDI